MHQLLLITLRINGHRYADAATDKHAIEQHAMLLGPNTVTSDVWFGQVTDGFETRIPAELAPL